MEETIFVVHDLPPHTQRFVHHQLCNSTADGLQEKTPFTEC
jgi:hypothetical protein